MNCNFFRIFACHLEKHKEQMKITKIRTKLGEFQTPVTTDLDLVVARMRSEETALSVGSNKSFAIPHLHSDLRTGWT